MKYSPKKTDSTVRLVYSVLLIIGFVLMMYSGTGYISIITRSLSLVFIAVSLYIFIRYDCTVYEYILIERNSTLDFYVNRLTGKRGSYVCYFPLTDARDFGDYSGTDAIEKKFPSVRFSKYIQNFMSAKELSYVVFEKDGAFDCIIFEPSKEMANLISRNITRD